MKELEEYLNSKIGLSNNKNIELLKTVFTRLQLTELSERTIAVVGTNGKTSTSKFIHRLLKKNNNEVKTILTRGGKKFVTPLSITALTNAKPYENIFDVNDSSLIKSLCPSTCLYSILVSQCNCP